MSFTRFALSPCIGFSVLLLALNSAPLFAAAYKFGIAPSLPEPVEDLQETEDDSLEARIRKGLKVKSRDTELKMPPAAAIKTQELPDKYQAWKRVLNELTKETGIEFQLVRASSQLNFELGLAKGRFDLAYVSPMQLKSFKKHPGYKAIAKRKAQPIRGIVFVKKNSDYRSLTQLRGSTLAFPSPLNFDGSISVRHSLTQLNFDFEPAFLAEQTEVYKAISQGQFDAGSGTRETYNAQPPEIRNALHIIWDSPGYTPYPLIAHPRVPFLTIIKLQRALANIDKKADDKSLLKHIFVNNGFEVAKNSDWHDVEGIELDKLNRHAPNPKPATTSSTEAP